MKTWFESAESVKKHKHNKTIVYLLLILVFAWSVILAIKIYYSNTQHLSAYPHLPITHVDAMRNYVIAADEKPRGIQRSGLGSTVFINRSPEPQNDKTRHLTSQEFEISTATNKRNLRLEEKQAILRATRMHNTLRSMRNHQ